MQSEELDNRIRAAADHHHPAYDEKAWMKMEKLLDKHLPQKKDDRRRFFFFLLIFILIGGGLAALLLTGKNGKKDQTIMADQSPVKQTPAVMPGNTGITGKEENIAENNINAEQVTTSNSSSDNTTVRYKPPTALTRTTPARQTSRNGNSQQPGSIPGGKTQDKKLTNPAIVPTNDNPVPIAVTSNKTGGQPVVQTSKNPGENTGAIANPVSSNQTSSQDKAVNHPIAKPLTETTKPVANEDIQDKKTVAQKPVKVKNKRSSSFSLNFSAGPDVSMVASGKTGKMNLVSGVGMGYTYKDRLTLRTGFYTGNKIYTAEPGDYNPPSRFYYYYPNLEKIEANCRIYEIPVSLSYHFGHTKKQNWFASSGISSYLMKRETYNYFYKQSPTAPTISKQRTIRGINKHHFSVLTMSGGYQRTINKAMSVTVEPYLKVPLSGVGYGKVKLNSSGVLFTVGVKPFALFKKEPKPRP